MRPLYYILIFALIGNIVSCKQAKKKGKDYHVEYSGALRNFMMDGDISAKFDLNDISEIEHLYALGALENLQGEIQIWNSVPLISSVSNNQLLISDSYNAKASLLVYTSAEEWKEIRIPSEVISYDDLEDYVYRSAIDNNINVDEPFPFIIEGTMESIDWHVIKWDIEDRVHTHEKHRTSGLYGILKNKDLVLLGFHSNKHHSIFTHHTTNMHLHFKTSGNDIAGHVDDLTLGKNMILKFPEK
jgi:acetolactate decarboxylase